MKRHNDKKMDEVMKEFLYTNTKLSDGIVTAQIEEIWKKDMGAAISGYTSGILYKEQILYIKITSSPLKKELIMGRDKIVALINEALGHEAVREVRIS
jgi:hypothetical protein